VITPSKLQTDSLGDEQQARCDFTTAARRSCEATRRSRPPDYTAKLLHQEPLSRKVLKSQRMSGVWLCKSEGLVKFRRPVGIVGGYGSSPGGSSQFSLTMAHVEIRVYRQGLHDLLAAKSIELTLAAATPRNQHADVVTLKGEERLERCGREMKLVVDNAANQAEADPGLLRIIVRAHDFHERLIRNPDLTVPAIARHEQLTIGYLSRLLRLPSLAPDIVTAIINGKHPPQLSAKRLMRLALKLPTDWAEQRNFLGFQRV
jgi:hypothetical protein